MTRRLFLAVQFYGSIPRLLSSEHQREKLNKSCSAPVSRSPRHLPQVYSFHITLRCNNRQFLIAKGLRRDVLLAVLAKAQAKVSHRLYAICLMVNHLHLLIKPDDARHLPRLMHWVGWFSAMALNRLTGRCGHFWEAGYYATAIAPETTEGC